MLYEDDWGRVNHTLFWIGFGRVFLADDESKSSFGQRFADTADKSPWQRSIKSDGEF